MSVLALLVDRWPSKTVAAPVAAHLRQDRAAHPGPAAGTAPAASGMEDLAACSFLKSLQGNRWFARGRPLCRREHHQGDADNREHDYTYKFPM